MQHDLCDTPAEDVRALSQAAGQAVEADARLIVFPRVPSLCYGPIGETWREDMDALLLPEVAWLIADSDRPGLTALDPPPAASRLGSFALLTGDAAFDPDELAAALELAPDVLVLAPGSESELQAEAALEFALTLSRSIAPLVLVAEAVGNEVGEPGHGGSAILLGGAVLAEAVTPSAVLVAAVEPPLVLLGGRMPMPAVPPLLQQRLGAHQGRRLEVEYPADLD